MKNPPSSQRSSALGELIIGSTCTPNDPTSTRTHLSLVLTWSHIIPDDLTSTQFRSQFDPSSKQAQISDDPTSTQLRTQLESHMHSYSAQLRSHRLPHPLEFNSTQLQWLDFGLKLNSTHTTLNLSRWNDDRIKHRFSLWKNAINQCKIWVQVVLHICLFFLLWWFACNTTPPWFFPKLVLHLYRPFRHFFLLFQCNAKKILDKNIPLWKVVPDSLNFC